MAEGPEQHIGYRIRAARGRLGWSRETLGSKSGVSWAAITQMESGRRTNTRSDTLLALSKALGVTIEYLLGAGSDLPRMFGHETCFYSTDEEMLHHVSAFVFEGLERGEGVLVAMPRDKVAKVKKGLGSRTKEIETVDSTKFYAEPPTALRAYRAFVENQAVAGKPWARIVAEPPWQARDPEEERALMTVESLVESLLEVSFAPLPVTMLCPYDRRLVSQDVLDQASRTHPEIRTTTGTEENPSYEDPVDIAFIVPGEEE